MIKKNITYSLLLFMTLFSSHSQAQEYSESELKAAYIYNLTIFIDLPENNVQDQFTIGVYKNKKMLIILREMLKERKTHGKPIKVINIKSPEEATQCNLLYISKTATKEEIKNILKYTIDKPIVTVGDNIKNFCEWGGIINFLPNFYRKRFEINNEKALSLGIKISSKILILSKIITTNENKF